MLFRSPGARENEIRRQFGLAGRFVVLYIGAHGISHALSAVLDAAAQIADREVVFAFVGEGAEKAMLVRRAAEKGLANVRFYPGQAKALMPQWYAAADVALVPLRNIPLFETFIPSKMFEILAAARPVIGSVKGEARRILEQSGAAMLIDPEDSAGIAAAVRHLKADPALREQLGEHGRRFVLAEYDRRQLAARYARLLEGLTIGPPRTSARPAAVS